MSGVCMVPSSRMMWCTTLSAFLNCTSCPVATVAGFGLNARLPFCPVIVMTTTDDPPPPPVPVDGAVGVLPPPPPPPHPAAATAATNATAAHPALFIEVL